MALQFGLRTIQNLAKAIRGEPEEDPVANITGSE
jgi:hypothetical protein